MDTHDKAGLLIDGESFIPICTRDDYKRAIQMSKLKGVKIIGEKDLLELFGANDPYRSEPPWLLERRRLCRAGMV